jgi:hypothetical protein
VRTLLIGFVWVVLATPAHAGGVPAFAKLALVPAQCGTTTFGPCAPAFAFRSGSVTLFGSREPTPTCPGSSVPTQKVGTVTLKGVTKDGMPFSETLHSQTYLKTTFGNEGTCSLRGTQVIVPSLTGDLTCKAGNCRGVLLYAHHHHHRVRLLQHLRESHGCERGHRRPGHDPGPPAIGEVTPAAGAPGSR